jgi:hypothetical protein
MNDHGTTATHLRETDTVSERVSVAVTLQVFHLLCARFESLPIHWMPFLSFFVDYSRQTPGWYFYQTTTHSLPVHNSTQISPFGYMKFPNIEDIKGPVEYSFGLEIENTTMGIRCSNYATTFISKFRRQAAIAQSVKFACGLRPRSLDLFF